MPTLQFTTLRRQRNAKINYDRLIVAVEGIISKKQEQLETETGLIAKLNLKAHIEFWEGRLTDLKAKNS